MMADRLEPDEGDYLADFRVGVDFTVSARDMAEARALVSQTLEAEDSDGTPFVTRTHRQIPDDRSWGVSGWEAVPARPSQAALVQEQYPGLVGDLAVIETLETVLRAGGRPVVVDVLLPQATRDRVGQMLAGLDPVVRVDDPDLSGRLIYEGPARQAASQLREGVYPAFDLDDREYALVVAPSQLDPSGRVSRTIPRDRHDARTLDEIASLLRKHHRGQPATDLLQAINRRVETTRRPGLASWLPLDEQPQEASEHLPGRVHVGTIVWGDMQQDEPTTLVDTDPVRLTRTLATTLYETLHDNDAFAGATEFLEQHAPPDEWVGYADVEAWLDELRLATPYPAFAIQHVPVTGSTSPSTPPESATEERDQARLAPDRQEEVFTYRVPVDFSVAASNEEEARAMVDDALIGGPGHAMPARVQVGQQVHADGDVTGVLGWQHPDPTTDTVDPVGEVLRQRAHDLDADHGLRPPTGHGRGGAGLGPM